MIIKRNWSKKFR